MGLAAAHGGRSSLPQGSAAAPWTAAAAAALAPRTAAAVPERLPAAATACPKHHGLDSRLGLHLMPRKLNAKRQHWHERPVHSKTRAPLFAARTLSAAGQSRVTLSVQ